MNTGPLTAATHTDISGLPPSATPSAPSAPNFSDMLASATSSLAAFALLPTSASDALSSAGNPPRAPKKDPNTDNAAVPIALPTPVQPPPAAAPNPSTGSSNTSPPQTASTAAAASQTQPSTTTPQTPNGSAATGGTSNGSAQTTNGVALPSMASELNARVALGAQALLSQPSQTLATLPTGALQTAATPTLSPSLAGSHGATAPDPTAVLPKLAATATIAAATPSTAPTTLETALQSATTQTAGSPATAAATTEAAVLATTSDTTAQNSANPGLGTTPAPALVPIPTADAAPNMDSAPPPVIAASALDQVAASLKQVGKLGLGQIELQLKPAALGTVDVKLELTHDGRVAAVISADRSDTLMQLQRGSGELQQALRDAGLQTDSGSLSFNLRGDAQTSDQSGRQPSYATPQPAVSTGSSDDLLAVPAAIAGAGQASHSGLLNIQV